MTDFHARRFDRAAGSYDDLSRVQTDMAAALAALLPEPGDEEVFGDAREAPPFRDSGGFGGFGPVRILELGCGTGHLTRRLRAALPEADILATDAAPRMLERAAAAVPGARFAACDASGLQGAPEAIRRGAPYDLAASNALVQWFPDLAAHLRLVSGLLAPGGLYLVSGFLEDNFPELNAILAAPPFGYVDFPGHNRAGIEAAAAAAGFAAEIMAEGRETETFPDVRAFLGCIRGLGASRRPAEGNALTRGRLEILSETYRRCYSSGDGGIRATWRPWYARLRKPA